MALKKLRKAQSRDAQAFMDDSSGLDTLRDVLADMAKGGLSLQGHLEPISAPVLPLDTIILPFPVLLVEAVLFASDWGDSGSDIVVDIFDGGAGGGSLKQLTVPITQADNTAVLFPLGIEVPANRPIQMFVTVSPVGGAELTAYVSISPIEVE